MILSTRPARPGDFNPSRRTFFRRPAAPILLGGRSRSETFLLNLGGGGAGPLAARARGAAGLRTGASEPYERRDSQQGSGRPRGCLRVGVRERTRLRRPPRRGRGRLGRGCPRHADEHRLGRADGGGDGGRSRPVGGSGGRTPGWDARGRAERHPASAPETIAAFAPETIAASARSPAASRTSTGPAAGAAWPAHEARPSARTDDAEGAPAARAETATGARAVNTAARARAARPAFRRAGTVGRAGAAADPRAPLTSDAAARHSTGAAGAVSAAGAINASLSVSGDGARGARGAAARRGRRAGAAQPGTTDGHGTALHAGGAAALEHFGRPGPDAGGGRAEGAGTNPAAAEGRRPARARRHYGRSVC